MNSNFNLDKLCRFLTNAALSKFSSFEKKCVYDYKGTQKSSSYQKGQIFGRKKK